MAIIFDYDSEVWRADDAAEITSNVANNFLKYGQPFSPYDPEYDFNYEANHFTLQATRTNRPHR